MRIDKTPGQMNIFDTMPKRSLITDGFEITSEKDIKELVGESISWESITKSSFLWLRYDLSSGTLYEAFRVLSKDSDSMDIMDGSRRRIYKDSLIKAHKNGAVYVLKEAT